MGLIYTIPYVMLVIVVGFLSLFYYQADTDEDKKRITLILAGVFLFFFGFRGYILTDWVIYLPHYENIPKQCKLGYFYRYFPALIESLRRKNYDRSIIYYEKLQRWEYPFTSAMKNHIENYLEQIKKNEK